MEKETFRYQLYELKYRLSENIYKFSFGKSIHDFKKNFYVLLSICFVIVFIGFSAALYGGFENTTDELFQLIFIGISIILLYILLSVNLDTLLNNDEYLKCSDDSCSQRSGVYQNLENQLNKVLNMYYTSGTKQNYFMANGFSSLGDEFMKSLSKRLVSEEELRAISENTHDVNLLTTDILRKVEQEVFVYSNGKITGVNTRKLLPYLKLFKNKDYLSNKNDIDIINEKYRDWVCSHKEVLKTNRGVKCEQEGYKYVKNPLHSLIQYDTYPDIKKKLSSLLSYGWAILFFYIYTIYHLKYPDEDFRKYLIISLGIALIVCIFYYIMILRYK